jgi:hypothetical protein
VGLFKPVEDMGSRALSADVIGDTPFQGVPPFWPSDHAGVVAGIRLH